MTNIDKERAKKIRDHKFYLENFCKVKTKDHGLQPFVLKEAQKDIFNEMKKHNRIIILKARQLGFSTAITGFFYVDTIMRPGVTTALIGYNSDMVAELLDKVKTFYRTTPEPLRPRTQYDSKYQMSFPKMDSKILVLPNTKDVGRGYTIHNCLSGNTDVFTQNGRTKKIKDVNVGDWIVNGNGGLSKVESFAKLENKENLLELDVVGCGKIRMTKDHQVLTREFKTGKEVWKRADELVNNNTHISKYNEYIAYPYFQPRKRFKEAKIENTVDEKYISRSFVSKANIKLDYDLGCLVGWYLAEGTTSYGRVSFSLDKSEVDSFIKLAGKFQGNYISRISTSPSKDSRTVVVYLYSKNFSNFIEQYFGRTEEKCINDSVWYWGPDFLKGLIYGLFRGDGCFNEKNKVILTSTNESIIYQTKKILVSLRIGVPNIYKNKSYRYNKENKDRYDLVLNGAGNYKFRRIFNLDMPSNFKYSRWRTIEEKYKNRNIGNKSWRRGKFHYWMKIRDIKEVEPEGYVYDIGFKDEPHSFLTTCGVVHNCLITELSSWEDADEKLHGLTESVPENGRIVIESCVSGDTLVLTDQGPRYIRNIHDWDNNKLGFSEGKEIFLDGHYGLKPTTTYYNSGKKKGFKVITRLGYELKMSSVHKLYVLNDNCELEFREAKDLNIGDNLTIKYGQELWNNSDGKIGYKDIEYGFNKKHIRKFNVDKINKELAYLVGLILGDGFIYKNKYVTISNVDEEIVNFLLNNNLGLKFYQEDDVHYRCTNKSFVNFLREYIGLKEGDRDRDKKIPEVVLQWNRDNIVSFLQGLFDANGSCKKNRGGISFTSTSKKVVDALRMLLLNFGIICRTYGYTVKPTEKTKCESLGYKLEISNGFDKVFLNKIGFGLKRKNNRLLDKKNYDSLNKFIPDIGKIIRENKKELGLKFSSLYFLNKRLYSKSGKMTYEDVGKVLNNCNNKDSDIYKRIKEIYNCGYYYDEIEEIIPIEENVYDFTVDDGHTVTYNGFVGHQTPRGQGNLYHRLWMTDNEYLKKEYGWWWEYTKEYMEKKKRSEGEQYWAQEYGLEFLASGRNVFDQRMIKEARKNILEVGQINKPLIADQKETTVREEEGWIIYRDPSPDKPYVCGGDVSEGVEGGDYSVAIIWDRETGEEVAFYRGLLPPDVFGEELNKMGRRYNEALMVVEANNHGLTTLISLRNLMYPNMYFRRDKFDSISNTPTTKMGWRTTYLNRKMLIDEFSSYLRKKELIPRSKKLLDEMSVFIYNNNGDMIAQSGFHDDTIFAGAIGLQGFKQMYFGKLTQIDENKHLPQNFPY